MKYTARKLRSLLDKAKVHYYGCESTKKKKLIALLIEKVDRRYYLLELTSKQLRDKLYSMGESEVGRKDELIKRIWDKKIKINRTEYGDIIKMHSEDNAGIMQVLDQYDVKYKTSDKRQTLIDLLAEHVDIRFKFWGYDKDELKAKCKEREVKLEYDADKQTCAAGLWKLGLEDAYRSVSELPPIGPTNHRIHTEAAAPLHREPISDFLRLRNFEELVSAYKSLTGKVVIPSEIVTIEDLSRAVGHLEYQNELDNMFKTKLGSDTLSIVMSFLPTDTYDQDMRIKMIEEAEQYGNREIIKLTWSTLDEMIFYREWPQYIDEDSTELRRSQIYLKRLRGGFPASFSATFAKYYNTYIRGDVSRIPDVVKDLESKYDLCLSCAHNLEGKDEEWWKDSLNYDNRFTMRQRMDKLNKLRSELDTTVHKRIDMARIKKFRAHGPYCLDEVTQEDVDNVALLGTYSEILIMKYMYKRLYEPNIEDRKHKLDELLREGSRGKGSDIRLGTFPGGNYRKAMTRLYEVIYGEMEKYTRNNFEKLSLIFDICLLISLTGVQEQWKMTRYEWGHGRTQERYDNFERKKIEAHKRTGRRLRKIEWSCQVHAIRVGKGIPRKHNDQLVYGNVSTEGCIYD